MKKNLFFLLSILLFLSSCKDEAVENIEPKQLQSKGLAKTELQILPSIKVNNNGNLKNSSPIGNYDIDLSNPPRSVNINGKPHSHFKYWFDTNVASKVPYEIRNDIKGQDGWEVIYNTIQEYNPSTGLGTTDFPFIGLYNRYRGIFRFFYYHPLGTEGNDVVGILALNSSNSKILNHPIIGESFANNQNQKYKSTLSTALTSNFSNIESGLAPNHWYCFDFDVSCYDENSSNGGLKFAITTIQRNNLEFSGDISGSITGSIIGSSSSSGSLLSIDNLISNKTDNTTTTNVNLEINDSNADAMGTTLENKADNSSAGIDIKNLFKDVVKDGVNALKKGVSGFMSSGISGLFSSISSSLFGSSSPNVQQVKLHTQLDLKGTGTITSKNSYSFDLEFPNKKLGILHLNSTPTVQGLESIELNTGLYNIDPNNVFSYMLIHYYRNVNISTTVNTEIENEVDIYTTSKIIYMSKNPNFDLSQRLGMETTPVEFTWDLQKLPFRDAQIVGLDKNTEIWQTKVFPLRSKVYNRDANRSYQPGNRNFIVSDPIGNVFVKVNFKIVPKNGTAPYYLQKVFRAKDRKSVV